MSAADPREAAKRAAAERALAAVQSGMVVALGTGSTARFVIEGLGGEVRRGLSITALASSEATAALARAEGIPLATLDEVGPVDLMLDGADEVAPDGALIKGKGGALLREKVLATAAARLIIVVDETKLVSTLGGAGVPVEVFPFARALVARALTALRLAPALRQAADGSAYLTDQGNFILDCQSGPIADPGSLARALDGLVGVAEHGLFLGFEPEVVVGRVDE